MPQLSIVVPIYKVEKYIATCLDAILAQTFTDFELILVDDGSPDKSGKVCDEYAERYSFISVIHKQNEGAGSARNAGIAVAKGRYIAFSDADDYIVPGMYENLMEQAKKYEADIIYCGIKNVYYNKKGEKISDYDVCYPFMHFATMKECRENTMRLKPRSTLFDSSCNKIYKLSVIVGNRLQYPLFRRVEDSFFNLEFFNCVNSVVTIPDIYYNYRRYDRSEVWWKFNKNYIEFIVDYYKRFEELMTQWGLFKDEVIVYFDSEFITHVWIALEFCINPGWKMNKKQKVEYIQNILNMEYVNQRLTQATVREKLQKHLMLIQKRSAKGILNEMTINRFKNSVKTILTGIFYRPLNGILKRIPFLYKLAKRSRSILKRNS